MPDFTAMSLTALLGLFFCSAVAVSFAGSRLATFVGELTDRTRLGEAFAGMLLLGGITSLPELAAVSTSAASGNASLAVNNLLGTAAINIVLLAVADVVYGRGALTAIAARPVTLLQGVLAMLLSAIVAMVATVGDVAVAGAGIGSGLLFIAAVGALYLSSGFEQRHTWEVVNPPGAEGKPDEGQTAPGRSIAHLNLLISSMAAVILVAGFVISSAAEAIASKTGLDSGIVGFVLIGFATSLPEVSSIMAAVKQRRYAMAIGDVFGTNIFNILLIFVADLIYREGPVLGEAGRFEIIGSIMAVTMTGIFIVGLLERRDRTMLRMGYDSLGALLVFVVGLCFLAISTG